MDTCARLEPKTRSLTLPVLGLLERLVMPVALPLIIRAASVEIACVLLPTPRPTVRATRKEPEEEPVDNPTLLVVEIQEVLSALVAPMASACE